MMRCNELYDLAGASPSTGRALKSLLIYYYWCPNTKCNAFCKYQSVPFHCLLESGAEFKLGREERNWISGYYRATRRQIWSRIIVSSTLLSTTDRTRFSSPSHVPKGCCSCNWQSCLYLQWWRFSICDDDDCCSCSVDDISGQDGKETHWENCISTWLILVDCITMDAVCI